MDDWESYFKTLLIALDYAPYRRDTERYTKLLWRLHNTPFRPMLSMDENRIADALIFRRKCFKDLDEYAVGMLEMMLSLAKRLETDIMSGTSEFDRTVCWFWSMIKSLGLLGMTDESYDEKYVQKVLIRFMNRTYSSDGRGGLFAMPGTDIDLRNIDIWYQAAFYLTGLLKIEGYIDV